MLTIKNVESPIQNFSHYVVKVVKKNRNNKNKDKLRIISFFPTVIKNRSFVIVAAWQSVYIFYLEQ